MPSLGNKTAGRLLEVAERLFAEHGVEQVPLRRIVVEAGQRNRSALHYHFHCREALVSCLLNYRMTSINQVRERYLDQVVDAGQGADLRVVVRASIGALADALTATPWGTWYVRVLAQAMFSPRLIDASTIDVSATTGLVRARRMIEAVLPDVRSDVLERGLKWFSEGVVFSLAMWAQQAGERGGKPAVDALADFHTSALRGLQAMAQGGSDRRHGGRQ